jgi:hypothetical protein
MRLHIPGLDRGLWTWQKSCYTADFQSRVYYESKIGQNNHDRGWSVESCDHYNVCISSTILTSSHWYFGFFLDLPNAMAQPQSTQSSRCSKTGIIAGITSNPALFNTQQQHYAQNPTWQATDMTTNTLIMVKSGNSYLNLQQKHIRTSMLQDVSYTITSNTCQLMEFKSAMMWSKLWKQFKHSCKGNFPLSNTTLVTIVYKIVHYDRICSGVFANEFSDIQPKVCWRE